ncbi:MAG: NADH:flavin oxidoreductase [Desulfuromonadales bacterium]|nr:NADH:flavin oxidoreductase [Desulfuromonadales bacterium]
MRSLFERCRINGMELRNRLVRSATWEGMCDEAGRPTEQLVGLCRELAEGGVGLIVSGFAFVREDGKSMPFQMGIDHDRLEADCRQMVAAVHAAGGKIALQLAHAGGQTKSKYAGRQPFAPSAVPAPNFPAVPAPLSTAEIAAIITSFQEGARRARDWGFDAVQFHGGHGYLISQFASPLTNRRTDGYGGSIENRARFVLELYAAVRAAVGPDYPVMVKMNIADHLDGGLEPADGLFIAQALAAAGIDAIEVSAGTMVSGEKTPTRKRISSPDQEAYHLDLARLVKQAVNCPVIVVGGFRSLEMAEKAVRDDRIDLVALSRPLVREPHLPRRWQLGDGRPATCISCNGCLLPGLEGGGICCILDRSETNALGGNR